MDGSSLHMVDFLVQNSDSVNTQTAEGNTALHYCAIYNRPECMKLLLRAGADPIRYEGGESRHWLRSGFL